MAAEWPGSDDLGDESEHALLEDKSEVTDATAGNVEVPDGVVAGSCMRKEWTLVPTLVSKYGHNVNGFDPSGNGSPLHWACWNGHAPTVSFLLSKSADIDAIDAGGLQAVHLASKSGHIAALAVLWASDGTIICRGDSEGSTPLHHAAHKGLIHVVEWLYLRGVPVNTANAAGLSPLHSAILEGKTLTAQMLLRYGVSVSGRDDRGRTPLHCIGLKGRSTLLDSALRMRLDAFGQEREYAVKDEFGRIPRHVAGSCRSPCVSIQLASAACWLDYQAKEHAAAKEKKPSCLQWGSLIFLSWFPAPPRNLAVIVPVLLVLLFHVMNVLTVVFVIIAELVPRELLTSHLLLLTMAQICSQIVSVRFWSAASLADPGYCPPTPRLDADQLGLDGYEKLISSVQAELNALLRQLCELQQGTCKLGIEGNTVLPEKQVSQMQSEMDRIKAGIETGKSRLNDLLCQTSQARLDCYPSDYVALVSGDRVEKDPVMWGKRACVVCGRLRSHRSKHCKDCGRCVAHFDHHCPWLGNCVGGSNLHYFLKFLIWQFIALCAALWLAWELLEVRMPNWKLSESVLALHIKMLFTFNIIWVLFVGCMFVSQCSLAAADQTGYEADQSESCGCPSSCGQAFRNLNRAYGRQDPPQAQRSSVTCFDDIELGRSHTNGSHAEVIHTCGTIHGAPSSRQRVALDGSAQPTNLVGSGE